MALVRLELKPRPPLRSKFFAFMPGRIVSLPGWHSPCLSGNLCGFPVLQGRCRSVRSHKATAREVEENPCLVACNGMTENGGRAAVGKAPTILFNGFAGVGVCCWWGSWLVWSGFQELAGPFTHNSSLCDSALHCEDNWPVNRRVALS